MQLLIGLTPKKNNCTGKDNCLKPYNVNLAALSVIPVLSLHLGKNTGPRNGYMGVDFTCKVDLWVTYHGD